MKMAVCNKQQSVQQTKRENNTFQLFCIYPLPFLLVFPAQTIDVCVCMLLHLIAVCNIECLSVYSSVSTIVLLCLRLSFRCVICCCINAYLFTYVCCLCLCVFVIIMASLLDIVVICVLLPSIVLSNEF